MPEKIFTIEADQWSEHGYIFRDGYVSQYETDRKEQTHAEFSSVAAEIFIADTTVPMEIRDWVKACCEPSQ